MANTRLSNPIKVAANNDPRPSNVQVTPANGSDGAYTWTCVGQKDTGSSSTITFSVVGMANTPSIVAGTTNDITANCSNKGATTNYVQVTAAFVSPSNATNWTILVGSTGNGNVRFVRGTGGGATRKPAVKATVARVARQGAKKAARKAAKKPAARKAAAKKPVKKAVSRKAAKKRK